MKWKPQSIRTRLALWYAGITALIIILLGISIYFFVRERFHRQIRSTLKDDLQNVEALISSEGLDELYELEEHGSITLYAVVGKDSVVYSSQLWNQQQLNKALQDMETGAYTLWENSRDEHFYFLKEQTETVNGWIVTAASVETVTESLYDLLLVLIAGIPVAIALAVWAGYFWAGRALAPVGSMAETAREISAQNWSRRLPVENPDDELGQLAIVINKTFDRLQQSFEQMRQFTADASHELRTPLTALKSVGEVGLQDDHESPKDYRNVIGSMLEEVDRLSLLVQNLLTLARADAGRIPLNRSKTDVEEVIREAIRHIQILAEEKEQTLSFRSKAGRTTAWIDRDKIRQSVVNILDNAIKYTPEGEKILVTLYNANDEEICIEVKDTGPGIPAGEQHRIFGRFYRVSKDRASIDGGTGLGLSIAQWAVQLHNGRIELESYPGDGSQFTITLPINKHNDLSES